VTGETHSTLVHLLFMFRFTLLIEDCLVVDGPVIKLEIAAAEAVLPSMIGRSGGAGYSGVSLAETAASLGPKASTHDDG